MLKSISYGKTSIIPYVNWEEPACPLYPCSPARVFIVLLITTGECRMHVSRLYITFCELSAQVFPLYISCNEK